MGVSDYNSANKGVIAGEGVVVVGILVPCYVFFLNFGQSMKV